MNMFPLICVPIHRDTTFQITSISTSALEKDALHYLNILLLPRTLKESSPPVP